MSDIVDIAKDVLRRADLLVGGGRGIDASGKIPVEIVDTRDAADKAENRPGKALREKILNLPEEPGVYLYVDKNGAVIYVGKAKRLKRRVSSYFNRVHSSPKTNRLVRNIADMRFIVVPTEEEALHLEDAMIKHFKPYYNILLKDDKSYPYIVVTNEPFPRVFMTREKSEHGTYYGPYANPSMAKLVLDLIRELFPLRSCKHFIDAEVVRRGKLRLCLDYHIKKCGGACEGLVSRDEYAVTVDRVKQILRGETQPLLQMLKDEMKKCSDEWRFEDAQALKEKVHLLERYNARSVVASNAALFADVFSYVDNGMSAFVNFMHLSHGAVVQTLTLEYRRRMEETKEEILSMSIGEIQRRFQRRFSEVIVPFMPDVEFENVSFVVPSRGDKLKLLKVSLANAERYMADREKMAEKMDPERGVTRLMQRMKEDFRLSVEPRHIECFDNSNIQGTNPVASCVVFRNGKPSKRDYRHFIIKSVEGPNDFASMKEVLHRRYSRMISEGTPLPQLVVVDGGKGQLSSAVEAFDEMGIRGEVALIGIAKRLEEIYFPGDSYPLYIDKKSESLRVIQALRDEAHRFGITHHRNRRSHSQVTSELDNIPGVGPATSAALMKAFKSVRRLKMASSEEISAVVGKAKAKIIADYFSTHA
jgi:excinuclease ABC subunit C